MERAMAQSLYCAIGPEPVQGFFGRDRKSSPFVGNVRRAMSGEQRNKASAPYTLPLAAMQAVEKRITKEALGVLSTERSVASRTSLGGTAPRNVRRAAQHWLKVLAREAR
jgi:argininosuccinate lyase